MVSSLEKVDFTGLVVVEVVESGYILDKKTLSVKLEKLLTA